MDDLYLASKLSEKSWEVLKKNKKLILFPVLSVSINLFLFYIILIASEINFYIGVIILYFISNFIGIFFNSVLVAYIKLNNGNNSVSLLNALNLTSTKIDNIIYWSIFQATVGYVLSIIASNKISKIFVMAAEVAWSVVTYFVVPIIIIDNKSVSEAVADSKNLIKKHWTDALKGEFILSTFIFIIFFVFLIAFIWVTNSDYQFAAKYVAIVGVVVFFISVIINSALIQIYHTLLYLHLNKN